jgi:putative NADH-flavin reductase
MKISIIGASQGTGALAVKDALDRGHAVTAFARTPERLGLQHAHLTLLKGDFHQAESVSSAVRGQDAIIITAGAKSLKAFKENPSYFTQGTRYVVDAMKQHGVKRLVVLSAFGTNDTFEPSNFLMRRVLIPFVLKVPYADHERQEELVRNSDLDWVIARPTRLTNGPAHHRYVKETSPKAVPWSISRADVASFLVEAATVDTWARQAVQLGG